MKKVIYKIIYPLVRIYWRISKPKTSGSRGIILYENSVLLAKHINVKYWSLPGGTIERGENPEECILRELKEELNLSGIKINEKLGEYISNQEGKKDTIHIFILKVASLEFQKQWELEDARWFDLNRLPQDISPAGLRRIKEYIAGKKSILSDW